MTCLKILHIVGIVGVPGNYGGFETLADHLLDSRKLASRGIDVYCESAVVAQQGGCYKGARLLPVNWHANGWQSIVHDSVGLWSASRTGGVVLVLGTSATFWLPLLRRLYPRNRYLVNMAGLEWARAKWGGIAKAILKYNEAAAARHAHVFIADNQGLVDYVMAEYGRAPTLIAYGGDQFQNVQADKSVLEQHKLPLSYDFAMARAQKDNNMEMILQAYLRSGLPLVFVSNWESNDYGRDMRERYSSHSNLYLIGPIYEPSKVKALHSRVRMYVHGHSAGGTNPVLVESMWAGLPTAAFDVNFHRHTTHQQAFYFRSSEDLESLSKSITSESLLACGEALQRIAEAEYSWDSIRAAYENIIQDET
jgi:glycosyltransferase involved in cell wall biosynthesis